MIKALRKRYEIITDKIYKEKKFMVHESFMVHDFGEYAWSLRSLDRRLSYFNIHRDDKSVSVQDDKLLVNKEMMGPDNETTRE